MLFGADKSKGIRLDGSKLESVNIGNDYSVDDILVHDESNKSLAFYLSEITLDPDLPTPIGVLYKEDKPTYDDMMIKQIDQAIKPKGQGDLRELLKGLLKSISVQVDREDNEYPQKEIDRAIKAAVDQYEKCRHHSTLKRKRSRKNRIKNKRA